MNKEQLLAKLQENEISCDDKQLNLLMSLMDSTLMTNEKFNLTAIKEPSAFIEKMIFDSALALYDLDLNNKSIIDVGTGAGFPGMVIKILSPNCQMTLLDSTKKKIDYLNEFALANNIDISGVSERAEDHAKMHREHYDYATARAVAHLSILLEFIVPMLKVNGYFLALKGAGYEDEINESSNALKKLNCHIEKVYEFELPESLEKRAVIYIKKDKATSKKYPRSYADMKRLPL